MFSNLMGRNRSASKPGRHARGRSSHWFILSDDLDFININIPPPGVPHWRSERRRFASLRLPAAWEKLLGPTVGDLSVSDRRPGRSALSFLLRLITVGVAGGLFEKTSI